MAYPVQNIQRQLSLSKQQDGIQIREPSTALFCVNSYDRYAQQPLTSNAVRFYAPTSPYDFTIQANQSLFQGFFTRLAVTEVSFNWTIPTITGRNNRLGIRYGTGGLGAVVDNVIVVPSGWYTPTTLATELQTDIRTISGNSSFTVTVDATSGAFTFRTNVVNDTFQLLSLAGTQASYNQTGLYEMLNIGQNCLLNLPLVKAQGDGTNVIYTTASNVSTEGITGDSSCVITSFSTAGFNNSLAVSSIDVLTSNSVRCTVPTTTGYTLTVGATVQLNLAQNGYAFTVTATGSNVNAYTYEGAYTIASSTSNTVTLTKAVVLPVGTYPATYTNIAQIVISAEVVGPNPTQFTFTAPNTTNATLTSNGLYSSYYFNDIQQGGVPSMLSTEFVDIVCLDLTSDQAVKDGSTAPLGRDLLCRVYLNSDSVSSQQTLGSTPFAIHRTFPYPKQIKWLGQKNIGNLRFQCYDDKGLLLTTGQLNNAGYTNQFSDALQGDFQMSLLVSEN